MTSLFYRVFGENEKSIYIYNMERKSSAQSGAFLTFTYQLSGQKLEVYFLAPICSKFSEESEWNSKISQKVWN